MCEAFLSAVVPSAPQRAPRGEGEGDRDGVGGGGQWDALLRALPLAPGDPVRPPQSGSVLSPSSCPSAPPSSPLPHSMASHSSSPCLVSVPCVLSAL